MESYCLNTTWEIVMDYVELNAFMFSYENIVHYYNMFIVLPLHTSLCMENSIVYESMCYSLILYVLRTLLSSTVFFAIFV